MAQTPWNRDSKNESWPQGVSAVSCYHEWLSLALILEWIGKDAAIFVEVFCARVNGEEYRQVKQDQVDAQA